MTFRVLVLIAIPDVPRQSFLFFFDKQEYSCLFLISLLCVFVCFYLSATLLNAFKDHCDLLWLLKTHGS